MNPENPFEPSRLSSHKSEPVLVNTSLTRTMGTLSIVFGSLLLLCGLCSGLYVSAIAMVGPAMKGANPQFQEKFQEERDKEIADLRSLLEQQSYAHDGMAIGVAAVAEMIESDALIIAERVRLRELQQDWEQKQRHVEIEMSMERAKLARERLELQDKVRNFEDLLAENSQPQQCEKKDKGSGRGRWLARLGLRDE